MKSWYEKVEDEFVKNINDTYTLNLAISVLEDREDFKKEIEDLKKDRQELIESNVRLREAKLRLQSILNEFDKWLLGEQMMFYKGSDGETLIRYGETTNKWLELKGSDKE